MANKNGVGNMSDKQKMGESEMMTSREVAALLRITVGALEKRRYRGDTRLPCYKISANRILYKRRDVLEFIAIGKYSK